MSDRVFELPRPLEAMFERLRTKTSVRKKSSTWSRKRLVTFKPYLSSSIMGAI